MRIAVRQQGQKTRALDSSRQLALILGLGTGNPAGNDLAGFGHIVLQRLKILVINFFYAICSKTGRTCGDEKNETSLFTS